MLRTAISPTMLSAGVKINVIPNTAEAQFDCRRLPTETHDEVFARLQKIIDDPAVSMEGPGRVEQPSTEPSSLTSPLYRAMEKVFKEAAASAVCSPGPLQVCYERLLARGMRPELARLTIARKIASIVLAIWKKGVLFDPTILNAQNA